MTLFTVTSVSYCHDDEVDEYEGFDRNEMVLIDDFGLIVHVDSAHDPASIVN